MATQRERIERRLAAWKREQERGGPYAGFAARIIPKLEAELAEYRKGESHA